VVKDFSKSETNYIIVPKDGANMEMQKELFGVALGIEEPIYLA
jgi:hypothetical protein